MGNGLWVACACLLQAVSGGQESVPAELRSVEVRAVEVDQEGVLWVGVRGQGLARVDEEQVEWVDHENLPDGVADLGWSGGDLWVVGLGGVARSDETGWTEIEVPNDPRVVFSVTQSDRSDQVWLGTNRGAVVQEGEGWRVYTESDGLPHQVVHQVVVDPAGDPWFLCRAGLARLVGGSFEVYRIDLNFRNGVVGPDGQPWFGTNDGVLRWTGAEFETELPGVTAYLKVSSDGAVWAGSASSGVLRRGEDGGWSNPLPELDGIEVFDLAEGLDGSIWVATSRGLWKVDAHGA